MNENCRPDRCEQNSQLVHWAGTWDRQRFPPGLTLLNSINENTIMSSITGSAPLATLAPGICVGPVGTTQSVGWRTVAITAAASSIWTAIIVDCTVRLVTYRWNLHTGCSPTCHKRAVSIQVEGFVLGVLLPEPARHHQCKCPDKNRKPGEKHRNWKSASWWELLGSVAEIIGHELGEVETQMPLI